MTQGGWRILWIVTIAVFSALPVSTVAMAQTAAQDLIEGDRAASAGKWEEALAAFEKAHAASPTATTARKRANALYQLKRTIVAYEAYEALLKEHGSTLARGDKDTALKRRDELRDMTGTIKINVSETGAQVSVDEAVIGTSPLNAPVRVLVGKHSVKVSKPGYDAFAAEIAVGANAAVSVDASLKAISNAGTVTVTVKGGEALTVVIDGAEVGPAPFTGPVGPGEHTVSGKSRTLRAAPVSVSIETGETSTVELVAERGGGTLEVRIDGNQGDIYLDGEKVGAGTFKGELSEGEHELVVKRAGYEDFEKKVTITAGEVQGETVTLRKATAGSTEEPADEEGAWRFDGLYGGFQLIGMFAPTGSGNTLETSCDVLGATSCTGGTPMGGGLGLYMGYAFAPVGLELLAVGSGDVTSPLASFDGSTGSDINPLVASPAREEEFIVGRFGGGGAFRLRLLFPIDRFRITGAIGAGLVYRQLLMGRDTVAADGAESSVAPDGVDYLSGVLSIELAAQVRLGGTTALALGANLWLEHAGDGVATAPSNDVVLAKAGSIPQPQATPAYDLAAGTQLFIGPFLGLHFGP